MPVLQRKSSGRGRPRVKVTRPKVGERLYSTHFKPRLTQWHNLRTAFQTPLDPFRDSVLLGNVPGQLIEHSSSTDFPVMLVSAPGDVLYKRIAKMETDIRQLKAANGLLRRFQDEMTNPRLRVLRALRAPNVEAVVYNLAEHLKLPIEKLGSDSASVALLFELCNAGYVIIENGIVLLTEAGKVFWREKLGFQMNVT